MDYENMLSKIHSFGRFGSRLGLERMSFLMELLGNPQDKMNVIHVAGTNGKGTVCRYITSILQENGYKVGQYTSPYIEQFSERIEYDEKEINHQDLIKYGQEVFEKVDIMISMGLEPPTEFELVTAIGFVYFSNKPVDFLVLEVGLGGKGDSTNIIKRPTVSVITSISYDHVEILGDSLEKIAHEKAGIIKHACPVISNVKDLAASKVIRETALDRGCDYYDLSDIQVGNIIKSLQGYSFDKDGYHIELKMIGMHQIENAICALAVIDLLREKELISIEMERVIRGIGRVRLKGRLEIVKNNPFIIIDGAHNEAGVKALCEVVAEHFYNKRILIVIGMLADKEVDKMISLYLNIEGDIIATEPDNHRKLSAEILCQKIKDKERDCILIRDWEGAYNQAKQIASKYDVILFSGSLYLIGKIREKFKNGNE